MDIQAFLTSPGPTSGFEAFQPGPWQHTLGSARAWQLALHLGDDPITATWAWSSTGGTRIDRLLLVSDRIIVLVEPWSVTSCDHGALRRLRTREQELLLHFEPALSKEPELVMPITDWHDAALLDLLGALYQIRRASA